MYVYIMVAWFYKTSRAYESYYFLFLALIKTDGERIIPSSQGPHVRGEGYNYKTLAISFLQPTICSGGIAVKIDCTPIPEHWGVKSILTGLAYWFRTGILQKFGSITSRDDWVHKRSVILPAHLDLAKMKTYCILVQKFAISLEPEQSLFVVFWCF